MNEDPIETYLDELSLSLRVDPRRARRILKEVQNHLQEATAHQVSEGNSRADASRQAIEAFGSPRDIANQFTRTDSPLSRSTFASLAPAILWLLAIGLLAIGASGLVSAGFGLAFGKDFVAGDDNSITYTASRCHQLVGANPLGDCNRAALADHYFEVVFYRIAAGVLGLVVAGLAYRFSKLRAPHRDFSLIGYSAVAALFGLAATFTSLQGFGQLVANNSSGAGSWVSGALVSIPIAALSALELLRRMPRSQQVPI